MLDAQNYTPDSPEIPNDLSGCLESFANSLEADIFLENLTLTAATKLAFSMHQLAKFITQLAQRGSAEIDTSNQAASNFTAQFTEVLTSDGLQKQLTTSKNLHREDTYFAALNKLAQTLNTLALSLLNKPTEPEFKALSDKLQSACTVEALKDEEKIFELSFLQPLQNFISLIDFADNRDKNALRPGSKTTIAESFPAEASALFAQITQGPLASVGPDLVQQLQAKAA